MEYLRAHARRDRRGRAAEDVWFDDVRQPRLGACRTANDGIPAPRRRSSTSTATPTPCRRCATAGTRRRAASIRTTASSTRRSSTASSCARSSGSCRPTTSGSTSSGVAARPTSCRASSARSSRRRSCIETRDLGSLRGVIVRSYATVAEEDNDGGSMMHVRRHEWPGAGAELIPDAYVLTEGTGCANDGAVGHLPRPARPDADRGRGHGQELPRLDAVGGPQSARARRADHRRGRRALPRRRGHGRRPVPRRRHAHGQLGEAATPERLRGPGALHVPLRPAPDGGRGPEGGARGRASPCPAWPRPREAGLHGRRPRAVLRPPVLARRRRPTTRRSTPAG